MVKYKVKLDEDIFEVESKNIREARKKFTEYVNDPKSISDKEFKRRNSVLNKFKDKNSNKKTSNINVLTNSEYYKNKAIKKYQMGIARKEGIKKARQQLYQQQVQKRYIATSTQQIAQQEAVAQARQRKIGFMGSRAEALEISAVEFNEIPMLMDMEKKRTQLTTPPDKSMTRIIKETTDFFPS